MTPDQIYAIKRVLMLPPDELAQLRENMRLHDDALFRIQNVMRPTNDMALDALTKLHHEIQNGN